jgi:uncharacterized membrane protein YfcA
MGKYITVSKYSFWKENRVHLFLIVLCGVTSLCGFIIGDYVPAVLNVFVVVLNVVFIYKNLPPKWARQEMKNKVTGA